MVLQSKDKVELGVAVLILAVYLAAHTAAFDIKSNYIIDAMVIASAVAIFGDNFLQAKREL
jgi:hypothetical protein